MPEVFRTYHASVRPGSWRKINMDNLTREYDRLMPPILTAASLCSAPPVRRTSGWGGGCTTDCTTDDLQGR